MADPIRVLCVDDNADLLEALRLRMAGEADLAWAGALPSAEGLSAIARETGAGIVLMDVAMPGPDPFESITHLASELPKVRVLLMTGNVPSTVTASAVRAGAWGCLSKNREPGEIFDAIRHVAQGDFVLE